MPRRIEVHIRNRFRKENLSKARITFLNRILTTMKQLRNEHGLSDKEILENLREQAKRDADFNELLGFDFATIPVEE